MRLGLYLDGPDAVPLAVEAERLGYDVVWVSEAWSSDAPSVLAWVAAQTSRIEIGSAVMQIPARAPTMTAMTAATLDRLSGGRFRLGLGVSGPQVSEGWYGVPFAHPLKRTTEYVDVVRRALRGERIRLVGDGPPLGLGRRRDIPLYLAALGSRSLALAGELADGWLAAYFSPEHAADQLAALAEGRGWGGRTMEGFDIAPRVPVAVAADVPAAVDLVRGHLAFYLGGMGSRRRNFYNNFAREIGFAAAATTIQDRYLAGDRAAAAAAVPTALADAVCLLGPPERIADRMHAYAEAGVTTLSVVPIGSDPTAVLRVVAEGAGTFSS